MKLKDTNTVFHWASNTGLVVACLCLLLWSAAFVQAADEAEGMETLENVVEGPFDGLDLKAKRIWINDMVYILDARVKVKGTHQKLGLITDLKTGEQVKAILRPNDETPSIPYVILIERQ